MEMSTLELAHLFHLAPIGINCRMGDPFQPTQWEGTMRRLLELNACGHAGPVILVTKSMIYDEQITWLSRFTSNLNLFVFFSITGLWERYKLEENLDNFKNFASKIVKVKPIMFMRPIIPGVNTKNGILEPIIETASQYSAKKIIFFRSYKPREGNEMFTTPYLDKLQNLCDKYGAINGGDSKWLAETFNIPSLKRLEPMGDDEANSFIEAMRYTDVFRATNGEITTIAENTRYLTQGDANFFKMFTRLNVENDAIFRKVAYMTRPLLGFVQANVESSWLGWGENKHCDIGCTYCIANNSYDTMIQEYGYNFDLIVDRKIRYDLIRNALIKEKKPYQETIECNQN